MGRKLTSDSRAIQYLFDRYIGDDPERIASYERASADADVAQYVYDLRTEAGLTRSALAKKVGTSTSVIADLEGADYQGHLFAMLRRVAAAVGRKVEVSFPEVEATAERPAKSKAKKPAVAATNRRTNGTAAVAARPRRAAQ